MPDILVTTPKGRAKEAAQEAADCIQRHDRGESTGYYFRNFGSRSAPPLNPGDRLYYVLDGWVRGFLVVESVEESDEGVKDYEGNRHRPGFYAWSKPVSWCWIALIAFGGFQGWRYASRCGLGRESVSIVGDWRDPMPEVGL